MWAERGEEEPEQDLRDGNMRLRAAVSGQDPSRQPGLLLADRPQQGPRLTGCLHLTQGPS